MNFDLPQCSLPSSPLVGRVQRVGAAGVLKTSPATAWRQAAGRQAAEHVGKGRLFAFSFPWLLCGFVNSFLKPEFGCIQYRHYMVLLARVILARAKHAYTVATASRSSFWSAIRQTDFGKSIQRSRNNIVSGEVQCAESSRGARLSSSFPNIDKFVERGPTIMSPPRRMAAEDRNFPTAENRPAFEQVN